MVQASNYAWDYTGTIKVDIPGAYTFCSWSDDGSFIYVDGAKVRCQESEFVIDNLLVRIHF